MTVTVINQENATRTRQLAAAAERLVAAEVTYIVALSADGPLMTESLNLADAQLDYDRAYLAAQLAAGVVLPGARRVVSITRQSYGDWIPMRWGAYDARPGETAAAQALRHATENNLIGSPHAWWVQVWTDPRRDAKPDGEWHSCTAAPDPLPPDTRAMPNGTELPDEHWNARLIREAAERAAGEPTNAQPVTFLTLALDGAGQPLADLDGVLYFETDALEVGAWHCNGIGYNLDIPAGDHLTARRWAVAKLADCGRTVISWQLHRDSIRSFWVPTIVGGQR